MSVRRRPPNAPIDGEILPPTRRASSPAPVQYRTPATPSPPQFGGFGIIGRLLERARSKNYKALEESLTSFEHALRAQERVARAIEGLELQEERLRHQNLEILREAERRNVDHTLAEAENRLAEAERRGMEARLRGQATELRLQRELELEQRRYDELHTDGKGGGNGVSEEEQLDELAERLSAAQEKLEGGVSEAEEVRLGQEISMILAEMEAVRVKHAQKL